MRYWTYKVGSQRTSKSRTIKFEPNFAGDGGFTVMCFFDGTHYHSIKPDSISDVRELQSQAAILAHTFKEKK